MSTGKLSTVKLGVLTSQMAKSVESSSCKTASIVKRCANGVFTKRFTRCSSLKTWSIQKTRLEWEKFHLNCAQVEHRCASGTAAEHFKSIFGKVSSEEHHWESSFRRASSEERLWKRIFRGASLRILGRASLEASEKHLRKSISSQRFVREMRGG